MIYTVPTPGLPSASRGFYCAPNTCPDRGCQYSDPTNCRNPKDLFRHGAAFNFARSFNFDLRSLPIVCYESWPTAIFLKANSTFSNDRGVKSASLSFVSLMSFGFPSKQTTIFAEGACRASFLRVKSVLASVTSSRKQTHIVRPL